MPNYTFLNNDTGEEITLEMRIAELDIFKKENPHMQQLLRSMALADPLRVGIGAKPSDGFRDVLREIKKKVPHNTIQTF